MKKTLTRKKLEEVKDPSDKGSNDKQSLKKKMQALMDNQKRMEQKKEKLKRSDDVEKAFEAPSFIALKTVHVSPKIGIDHISNIMESKSPQLDESPSDTVQILYHQLEEAKQRQKSTEMELARMKFEHEERIIDMQLSLVSI
jgi:hypothetical protein